MDPVRRPGISDEGLATLVLGLQFCPVCGLGTECLSMKIDAEHVKTLLIFTQPGCYRTTDQVTLVSRFQALEHVAVLVQVLVGLQVGSRSRNSA